MKIRNFKDYLRGRGIKTASRKCTGNWHLSGMCIRLQRKRL